MAMLAPVCSAIHFWLQPSVKHADESVTGIVEWSLPNLQHTQHGLKSTSDLRPIYRFALSIDKNVAVGLYTQR